MNSLVYHKILYKHYYPGRKRLVTALPPRWTPGSATGSLRTAVFISAERGASRSVFKSRRLDDRTPGPQEGRWAGTRQVGSEVAG